MKRYVAKYLTEMGHSDAARAEYEGVVTACASSTDLEYQELAKDAREGIRKLGKRYTGPKVR